ncbi:MAG: anthranilate synthase component I family protein [Coriobacteriaceae bacterium]|jgi:anthranilate synthase component 1|nr:anthranilate synthase component I family protein [Coriobacteriaceae bacterium]
MSDGRIQPSLDNLQGQTRGYPAVNVYLSLDAKVRDPLELFSVLKGMSRHCFILESLEDRTRTGRYTFLGYDPKACVTYQGGILHVVNGIDIKTTTLDPAATISKMIESYRCPRQEGLPPFTGGLVGYFAYDYIACLEPRLTLTRNDAEGFKDIDLMLFDRIVAYDHLEEKILLIATIKTDALEQNYALAAHELASLAELVVKGKMSHAEPLRITGAFDELFSEESYRKMVCQAKRHITDGDIFQVVLSNRLTASATGSLFETYGMLRKTSPSPYQFYFASEAIEMAGASPETLVKLESGVVETFPLAGTRPRGRSAQEDAQRETELLQDEKELAEHNMLVDLGRNDIGKVSRFGTVKVTRYLNVLRFSHVMHIGSTVQGKLAEGKSVLDVLGAVLPAGTLSGAPKLKACEIIDRLEDNRRGIYGGAIGYLAFNGNMDTCIAIRLVFKKQGRIFVRSGAGIVADSDPASEYRECRHKMQAVLDALESVGAMAGVQNAPNTNGKCLTCDKMARKMTQENAR